ncbi:hypothetical protein AB0K00_54725 [Dactylosporangium sp. NPDC049525]|uniref:hypothetical protein n=1 Tax=Dactylosporangium sp. NPDC049525 TaxID=3154730 RepID=UPI00342E612B
MTDWSKIDIREFMEVVLEEEHPRVLVGRLILERLPYAFDSKAQYLRWRDALADGFQVDARDIVIVGSAATGRSINSRKKFGTFHGKSARPD